MLCIIVNEMVKGKKIHVDADILAEIFWSGIVWIIRCKTHGGVGLCKLFPCKIIILWFVSNKVDFTDEFWFHCYHREMSDEETIVYWEEMILNLILVLSEHPIGMSKNPFSPHTWDAVLQLKPDTQGKMISSCDKRSILGTLFSLPEFNSTWALKE